MNVNSNKNTRDREKWHEGQKQTSENVTEREDEWCWGWWGQSNLIKKLQSRKPCLQVAIILIVFQPLRD
jgi:hypothetical protein